MLTLKNNQQKIYIEANSKINKQQKSVLYKSFLKSGIGFGIVGILSFIFSQIWINIIKINIENVNMEDKLILSIFIVGISLILISLILSIIWSFKPFTHSIAFTLTVWISYVLCQALGFSLIIYLYDAQLVLVAFGIGAIACFMFSLIGYFISSKTAITLQKIYFAILFVAISLLIMFIGGTIFLILNPNIVFMNIMMWIYFIVYAIFLLLLILSIIQLVHYIKRSSEFAQISDEIDIKMANKMSWFFGFLLLSLFIQMVWRIVSFMILRSKFRR